MKFRIEQRIDTLSTNALLPKEGPHFEVNGIRFSHWDFNSRDGWLEDAWIAETEVDAENLLEAMNDFGPRLMKVVHRIAFVSQSYTETSRQPFLVTRNSSDIGFFRYSKPVEATGLMFMEKEREALQRLMTAPVYEEFFRYWNDAVNTPGYTAKLLIMFSALEALVKHPERTTESKYILMEKILGKDLKEKLFGTKEASSTGLRHRLVHGEYLSAKDGEINYFEDIHKKVLSYFNSEILQKDLLEAGVTSPQRHPFGLRNESRLYLRPKSGYELSLRTLLKEFDAKGIYDFEGYESVWSEEEQRAFSLIKNQG